MQMTAVSHGSIAFAAGCLLGWPAIVSVTAGASAVIPLGTTSDPDVPPERLGS